MDSELSASFFSMFKEEEIYENDRSLYDFLGNSLLQDIAYFPKLKNAVLVGQVVYLVNRRI